MPTVEEVVEKVFEMRQAQIKYFKTRTYEALQKSKALEHDVDKIVDLFKNPQQTLF